jgi:hypothetical protein
VTDPLELLWVCLETDTPLLTKADLRHWPDGVVQRLLALKLLERTDNAIQVVCPNCDRGHVEEVMPRRGRNGQVRFFICCPDDLKVEVPEELLFQWTIDFETLVRILADALTLKGCPAPIVPERLWRLGKTLWQGANREVLLVRGLAWPDVRDITRHIGPNGRPIVLVADQVPMTNVWPGKPPAVVVLSQLVTVDEHRLQMDAADLAARVNEADQYVATLIASPVTEVEQTLAIRRQVKAEMKGQLEDDVLVAAYLEFGSTREAAKALSERDGRKITKDKVYRAVQRRGGIDVVARTEDSASVHRTVASQRRGRTRKILNPS